MAWLYIVYCLGLCPMILVVQILRVVVRQGMGHKWAFTAAGQLQAPAPAVLIRPACL